MKFSPIMIVLPILNIPEENITEFKKWIVGERKTWPGKQGISPSRVQEEIILIEVTSLCYILKCLLLQLLIQII